MTALNPLRLAVLTSTETRHRYFANALRKHFNVVFVGYQNTGYDPSSTESLELDPETERVLKRHFDDRAATEVLFFGHDADEVRSTDRTEVMSLSSATLSQGATVEALQRANVNAVAVFGTSLIRQPLLGAFAGRIVNLHLGLSPYYRGTATNFFPLLNGEPQYVGATVHLIDDGIDSGPILHHAQPDITADDRPHTVGCKAILAGIEKVIFALHELEQGSLNPIPQWRVPNARLYLRKDYHPTQVGELYRRIEGGLIQEFVAKRRRGEIIEPPKLIP